MVGLINKEDIYDIADAIREKTQTEDTFTPSQMGDLIRSIKVVPENSYQLKELTVPTSLATFDADALPMPKLKVSVDAEQDLHGYDKPWTGGAGKNKWSKGDISGTLLKDISELSIPIGTWTLSANVTSSDTDSTECLIYDMTTGHQYSIANITRGNRQSITFTTNHEITDMRFYASTSYNFSSGDTFSFTDIQLESGSTATTYAPYSNICPISGHTEANVSDVGKNKLEVTATSQTINGVTFTVNSDGTILANGTSTANIQYNVISDWISFPAGDYILNGCPSGLSNINLYVNPDRTQAYYDTGSGVSFSVASEIIVRISMSLGVTVNNVLFKPMIRLATETDSAFEPYINQTYTITFKDGDNPLTVYGGTLDVTSGELVVDRGMVDLGTLNWENNQAGANAFEAYSTANYVKPYTINLLSNVLMQKSSFVDVAEYTVRMGNDFLAVKVPKAIASSGAQVKQWLSDNNVTLCYELATPQTIQLTPTQVNSLLGSNNVWADTGNILEGEYFKAL